MNSLQAWMLLGIPGLALGTALFLVRSGWASLLGYVAMLAVFAGLAVYDRPSAAIFGGLLALVYAAGRGGRLEAQSTGANEHGVPDEALHPLRRRSG